MSQWNWHLHETFVKTNEKRYYLRRDVDREGEALDIFVTKTGDMKAVVKFLAKSIKGYGRLHVFVTDKLRSDGTALK